MSKGDDDYAVGYGKPPKHTRFRKGQSGNPSGRKPKAKPKEPRLPSLLPTAYVIRTEAERLVTIREGDRRYEITVREAVVRSLEREAMQGGILAQRTYLQYLMEEDKRVARKKRESFDFWRDYVEKARAAIARAQERGGPEPEFLPHPDDIRFGYTDLDVHFDGPMDEDQAAECARLRRLLPLLLELSLFHKEQHSFDPDDAAGSKLQFFFLLHIIVRLQLPQRMRMMSKEEEMGMINRACGSYRRQETFLRAKCAELEFPFIEFSHRFRPCSLRELQLVR